MRNRSVLLSTLALTLTTAYPSMMRAQVLTFEGLDNVEQIRGFYSGGTSQNGNSGANYGVSFSNNALAIISNAAGGSGNFSGEPSPNTVLFFLSGGAATLTYAPGFTTGFSFFYSAANTPGSITVYDGVNGTGNILANLALGVTGTGSGCPESYCPFVPIGVSFLGTARSVDFAGAANYIAFDNITIGAAVPDPGTGTTAPEPATLALMATGLGIVGGAARFRRRSV